MSRILVIGDINMDMVVRVAAPPGAGETVYAERYAYYPGGKGANQAVAAARLGAAVTLCGRVGGDENGRVLTGRLRAEGIDCDMVAADPELPTGLAIITVDAGGQNRIVSVAGANAALAPADVRRAFEREYDAVMTQLAVPLPVAQEAYRLARRRGIPMILDAGRLVKVPFDWLQGIDIISPNEREMTAMTGLPTDTDEQAALATARLRQLCGARYVVTKLGGRGAMLCGGETVSEHPTFADVTPVDTTAAGDSFTAALAVRWLQNGDMAGAVRYANAVGSICVTRPGAQPSLPTAVEVELFLQKYPAPD